MRFAERIEDQDLRQLYFHWLSKTVGHFPPARLAIDPAELRVLLPFLFIIEVNHSEQRFRFRLAGQEVEALAQALLHGRWLDEALRSPLREFFDEGFCASAFGSRVQFRRSTLYFAGHGHIGYARLLLPLSDRGSQIDHLLGCIKPDEEAAAMLPRPVEEYEIATAGIAFERDAYDLPALTAIGGVRCPSVQHFKLPH